METYIALCDLIDTLPRDQQLCIYINGESTGLRTAETITHEAFMAETALLTFDDIADSNIECIKADDDIIDVDIAINL